MRLQPTLNNGSAQYGVSFQNRTGINSPVANGLAPLTEDTVSFSGDALRFGHGQKTPHKGKTIGSIEKGYSRLKRAGLIPEGQTKQEYVDARLQERGKRKWRK
jgi:hypothetical protein